MPKLLIPNYYDKWLPASGDAREALIKTVNELKAFDSTQVALERKSYGRREFFTIDVNTDGFHRLVFIKVKGKAAADIAATTYYILAGIVLHHDYAKTLRGIFSSSKLPGLIEAESSHFTGESRIVESEAEKKMVFYNKKWLSLSKEQADLLRVEHEAGGALSLPRLILGPPGSGKSLVSLSFFQERALEHLAKLEDLEKAEISAVDAKVTDYEPEAVCVEATTYDTLRLLFLSPQTRLNEDLMKEWTDWVQQHIPERFRGFFILNCKTPGELLFEQGGAIWDKSRITQEISKIITPHLTRDASARGRTKRKPAATIPSAEEFYTEFWMCSAVLNADIASVAPFDTSNYRKIGARHTLLRDEEHRKLAYEIYTGLVSVSQPVTAVASAAAKATTGSGADASRPTRLAELCAWAVEPKYEYVCVDEMQNCTPQDIWNAFTLAKDGKFLGVGDVAQRGDIPLSSVDVFCGVLYENRKIKIPVTILEGTHRLRRGAASVCSQIIKLSHALQQGKDRFAYSKIESLSQEVGSPEEAKVSFIDSKKIASKADELRDDAGFAIVTLTEPDKRMVTEIASEAFARFTNILSVDEARGLQFPKVVVYLSSETWGLFNSISKDMKELGIVPGSILAETIAKPARESHYKTGYEMLSKLMTALSRSYCDAWIYSDSIEPAFLHHIESFYQWLRAECSGIRELEANAGTEMQWLALAHRYLSEGERGVIFATKCLCEHSIAADTDIAARYIARYRERGTSLTVEEGMPFLQKLKKEKADKEADEKAKPTIADTAVKKEAEEGAVKTREEDKAKAVGGVTALGLPPESLRKPITGTGSVTGPVASPGIAATAGATPKAKKMEKEKRAAQAKEEKNLKELFKAISSLKSREVIRLLAELVDVNKKMKGETPLSMAARLGSAEIVKEILGKRGIMVNQATDKGETPLFIAALNGRTEIVRELIKISDIAVNEKNPNGATPLFAAAQRGNAEVVIELLKISDIALNEKNRQGATPLHVAAENGHTDIVMELLKKDGIDVNEKTSLGATPLFLAAQNGYADIVTELLKKDGIDVNKETSRDATPLCIAATMGRTGIVMELLKKSDIRVNQATVDGETPLFMAARYGHAEVVREMLKRDDIAVNQETREGATPLLIATLQGYTEVVVELLKKGADVIAHPLTV